MGHVDAAIREMFRAVHMQLLSNACRLEKILLAALVMETRATGDWTFLDCFSSATAISVGMHITDNRAINGRMSCMTSARHKGNSSFWGAQSCVDILVDFLVDTRSLFEDVHSPGEITVATPVDRAWRLLNTVFTRGLPRVLIGRSDAVLRGVFTRMDQLCAARQEALPYCGDVISAAVRLGAKRLVLAGPGAHRLSMR
jgi:hypothetical protein